VDSPVKRIPVRDTNCYLLEGSSGVVLIDPGPPGGGPELTAQVAATGIQPEDVRLILITHGHLDHYGAARVVKAWCGAPIAASPGAPEFSRDPRNALPPSQTLRGSVIRQFYLLLSPLVRAEPLVADLAMDEGDSLASFGVDAQLIRLPGHAPGSLGLVTAEGDVVVGDLFVNYTVPSQPIYLSDRKAWQASCEQVRALQPRTVCPGHGEPFPGSRLARIYPPRYQLRWWVR